jgi:RNA recognition motif-containing protein
MIYSNCLRKRARSKSAAVVEDRETGRSRGFGFGEMSTKEEGASAIQQFNGREVSGRALKRQRSQVCTFSPRWKC